MIGTVSRNLTVLRETYADAARRKRDATPARSRLAYIGWVGYDNLGDEVMYEVVRTAFPDVELENYAWPRREGRLERLGLSGKRYFAGAFLGGGTLISPYYRDHVETALRQGLPLWSLGTGVGSTGFENPLDVDIADWKDLLPRFTGLGVRGYQSERKLKALGVTNAQVIGDIALLLTRDALTPPADPPTIAVNLALPKGSEYGVGRYAALTALEDFLAVFVRQGGRVRPLAMAPADIPPTQRLMDAAGIPEQTRLVRTADEFFALVADCTMTVAVRLHAAILSVCAGVPPLMLGYRDKCLDFMESAELLDWYVDINRADEREIAGKANELRAAAPDLRASVLATAQRWRSVQRDYLNGIRHRLDLSH